MNTERTRALTEQMSAAREAGDTDAIAALLAEDVVRLGPGVRPVTPGLTRDEVVVPLSGVLAQRYLHADSIHREILFTVADDDVSIVKVRLTGRLLDSGEDYENLYFWVYHWRDDLVVCVEEHLDTLTAGRRRGTVVDAPKV